MSPVAETSRVRLLYVEETAWGEVPSPAPTLKGLRITGESLKFGLDSSVSNEMRDDRQIPDLIQTGRRADGGFNFELSYGNLDELLEGALFTDWGTELTITANTISAAASDNSLNDSGSGFPAFVPGQWIKISGFTGDTSNNGYAQVVSRTTAKVIVSGITLVDDAAGESVTVEGTMIRNGVTHHSYVIEKEFSDIAQFFCHTGMKVSDFSIDFTANAIVTGSINFNGKSVARGVATVGDGSPTPAPTNTVMNAITNILNVREGGSVFSGFINKMNFSLKNNLRPGSAVGVLGAAFVNAGRCEVTGGATVYFQDGTVWDKFQANTPSSISFCAQDAEGNAYIFTFPKIKYSGGDVLAGGADADAMVDTTFQAMRDPITGCTIQIDRFAA
jgi:hypothetical protein